MDDLRTRLAGLIQLTSDGHKAYLEAVEGAFGGDVDYAVLHKIYGSSPESMKGKYSPAVHRNAKAPYRRRPGFEACQHVLCGAQQPDYADAHAPLNAPDKRHFKEGGKPRLCRGASIDVI